MSQYFHGKRKKFPYFEGWYLKHQFQGKTIAFIPAIHADVNGRWSASLQVIMDQGAWNFQYPIEQCKIGRKHFYIRIGENSFSEEGAWIHVESKDLSVKGCVQYSAFHGLKNDIMGPFRFFSNLQCNHGVLSMKHKLTGSFTVNGKKMDMTGGTGYVETDWGYSFPSKYLWTQCHFQHFGENSIMLSVADVPLFKKSIQGCICAILYRGREYRMATYLGVRVIKCEKDEVILKQGKMVLKVTKLGEHSFGLWAPEKGDMSRIIRESPSCKVRYHLWKKGRTVFDVICSYASFEVVTEAR